MTLTCILIVDDSDADQFLSRALIQAYDPNIIILQAHDGKEALNILNSKDHPTPNIILLDINMPGMGGLAFLEEYGCNATEDSNIPSVIMLTSSNQEKDVSISLTHHCVKHYLEKPLSADDIAKAAHFA